MSKYLGKLHEIRLFSLDDAVKITGNKSTAISMLSAGVKHKTICRIKSNLYSVTDLATGLCAANKYEIASAIANDACVAYHSAMEYYGFSNQVFNEMDVMTATAFRTFDFEGITYNRRKPNHNFGVVTPTMNSHIRVTDVERTILDCIDRIKYAGGLEELLNNLDAITFVNEVALVSYLELYSKPALYQKVGFILSHYKKQMHLSSAFFKLCKDNIGKSTRYLDETNTDTKYVSEWGLCVPNTFYMMTEKGGYVNI